MEQEVFILYANYDQLNLDVLNGKLKEGWKVVSTSPFGGGGDNSRLASVIVLEKKA